MYIFIGVFAITALLTLAGISGLLKMEEKYLKPLYRLLLLEVVAFILAFMTQTYLNRDEIDHKRIANKAGLTGTPPLISDDLEEWIEMHFERSATYDEVSQRSERLRQEYDRLVTECNGKNGNCPNQFHQDIHELIGFLPQYNGSINLDFEAKEKEKVYLVLANLLNQLERIEKKDSFSDRKQTKPNYKRIRDTYYNFRQFHRADEISKERRYFILPSDIGFLMQEYANRLRR